MGSAPVLEMIPKMPTVKGYSISLVVGDELRACSVPNAESASIMF
jgi:hypothetical protein